MSIENEIRQILLGLNPTVDKTKALLENDSGAKSISLILGEKNGVEIIEYLNKEIINKHNYLYLSDTFINRSEISEFIEEFFNSNTDEALNILLPYYSQIWSIKQERQLETYSTYKKIISSTAVIGKEEILVICKGCHQHTFLDIIEKCKKCGKRDLIRIYRFILAESVKSVIKNGQYLEMYIQHCMNKSGIKLLGIKLNEQQEIYTSINYQVEGENIDIDVHGLTTPTGIILCECKTTKKTNITEMRKTEEIYNRFSKRITNLLGGKMIPFSKVFITTGEFDINIPIDSYKRKGWSFFNRDHIENITQEFERLLKEI